VTSNPGVTGSLDDRTIAIIFRSHEMRAEVELPKAFSVRDEHEFFPIQHLVARLNPRLLVKQVATGVHVSGGCTVLWGIIHLDGQPLAKKTVEAALREAGFDFAHNVLTQASDVWTDHADVEHGRP
jgi:hypothetical protein